MRRVLFSLALLLALLIMPSQVAYAQEETNQSDDLYLFEIDSSDSSYSATKEEKVEAVLLSALDSFQTKIDLSEYKISSSEFNKICDNILDNNYR